MCVLLFAAARASAEPSPSKCHDDVCFSVDEKADDVALTLRGMSTFRYWGFRVYTGALYVPASASVRDAVEGEIPKKLVLRYHRSLTVEQFVEKSEETLESHPKLSLEALRPTLSRMNSLYVPVQEGDSYAITYSPKQSTLSLFFNGRLLGRINDRDFARAYFGIWLSTYSVGSDFTADLLGIDR